jgi:hypothetical protein
MGLGMLREVNAGWLTRSENGCDESSEDRHGERKMEVVTPYAGEVLETVASDSRRVGYRYRKGKEGTIQAGRVERSRQSTHMALKLVDRLEGKLSALIPTSSTGLDSAVDEVGSTACSPHSPKGTPTTCQLSHHPHPSSASLFWLIAKRRRRGVRLTASPFSDMMGDRLECVEWDVELGDR